jgi:tetratricopeptide repeat protein 8
MVISRLGMYREAEKQFKSALKQQEMVDTFLYLAKVSKYS